MGLKSIGNSWLGKFMDRANEIIASVPDDVKQRNQILSNLNNNYNHFDYDAESDAIYQAQRRQLERDQRSGVSDVLAQYAANTGMGGSSSSMRATYPARSSSSVDAVYRSRRRCICASY